MQNIFYGITAHIGEIDVDRRILLQTIFNRNASMMHDGRINVEPVYTGISQGVYFVRIKQAGKVSAKRIVIQ